MIRTLKNTVLILSLIVFTTCIDDNYDKNYSTFKEEQIASFLENHPELYSEFYALLQKVGIEDLLNAYGTYTCFAPTNDAVKKYYAEKNTSFEQLTDKDIKEIVYNHLLPRKLKSTEIPNGAISFPNLDDRYLYFSFGNETNSSLTVYVNETVRILELDQNLHNGIVHTVDGVIVPSHFSLPDVIAKQERYSLFSEALFATGLSDSLLLYNDEEYEPTILSGFNYTGGGLGGGQIRTPQTHHYGYTAFMESDSLYKANGINTLDDLKIYAASVYDEMYSTDQNITDITDRSNSLNRFIAYHLLDRMQAENEFIGYKQYFFTPGTIVYEYIEPICPNTLIEVQTGNLFNKKKDGTAIRIIKPNMVAENGVCHEIDRIMVYDRSVEDDVLNKRLRMSVLSMYPELITNKVRNMSGSDQTAPGLVRYDYAMPAGYIKGVKFTEEEGHNLLFNAVSFWNYMGEEMQAHRKWDFTLRLPPIPAGTYEIRFGYIPYSLRGVSQMYIDSEPCGIPLDMRMYADNPKIGWIADNQTDDGGVENDKMMHNRGYMKGTTTQWEDNQTVIARNMSNYIRKVTIIKTFHKTEPHYFRSKCVTEDSRDNAFHLNYFEFVPLGLIATEGRD
jgi:uncharacterized surface protein with fasciclin (FAS1) repeats